MDTYLQPWGGASSDVFRRILTTRDSDEAELDTWTGAVLAAGTISISTVLLCAGDTRISGWVQSISTTAAEAVEAEEETEGGCSDVAVADESRTTRFTASSTISRSIFRTIFSAEAEELLEEFVSHTQGMELSLWIFDGSCSPLSLAWSRNAWKKREIFFKRLLQYQESEVLVISH